MSAREKELQRLISYAQGLGVKVTIKYIPKHARNHDAGTWSTDGSEIEVFIKEYDSKTLLIMNIVHELGHHLWFIYKKKRKPDLKFDEAIVIDSRVGVTPKDIRKKILVVEREGLKYWDIILTDVNIKIPPYKVARYKEFDIWQYEIYYERGSYPNKKEREAKHKELKDKYKENKEC